MMNVATGAMGALLPMLGELLKEEYNLQKGVKKDVEFLDKELKTMHAALHKVAEVPRDQLDEQVRLWADDVREMSYNADDIIDAFLVRIDSLRTTDPDCSFKRLMEKMANVLKKAKAHRQIATAIRDIKGQVQEAADRRDRYRLEGVVATQAASATTSVDPRLLALYKDHKEIIGIEEPRNELIKRLTCGDDDVSKQQRKILSIVGLGGLGKTTLAKVVYDRLQGQFVRRAFVSVGRNPDVKKVFKDILLELDKQKYMNYNIATLDERQLINELRGLLENQRYFIVIDDIWDIKSWEIISCALVDNSHGSRIITTTRILEVARKADDFYKLAPLSHDKSQELFYTRLLGGKGKCPHDQPFKVSEKILQKCDGVPLAIITIASLLAGKPNKEDWRRVYNSIGFGYEENKDVENTRKILLFSYYDLSYCLRTCLLHIGIFPEDYLIEKETLIWKWVAEGFVQEEPGIGLFELGERYFNELINRSMIQPVQELGIIYGCRVHDMMLDMISSLAREENFFTILDSNEQHASSQSIARRLAIQKRGVDQHVSVSNTQMPKVRSFTATRCDFNMMPSLLSFRCLRVLAIEECTFMEYGSWHLKHLGKLLQLRYLGLLLTPIGKLPEEVGSLRFLQTLDLRGCGINELPQSVGRLRQLKCLRSNSGVSDWIGNLTSLEVLRLGNQESDLSPNFVKELGKLVELRELHIISFTSGLHESGRRKALVESLGNLQKIQVLELSGAGMFEEGEWEGFVPPRQLRHMILWIPTSRIPGWISASLVPKLSFLVLKKVQAVESKDVEILGRFSELTTLMLISKRSRAPPDVMGGGAFPKLTYLQTTVPFRFLQGAMPSLEALDFTVPVRALKRVNFDFDFGSLGNLPSLQKVTAEIWGLGAATEEVEDAVEALRHAVDIHPNRPILELHILSPLWVREMEEDV